MTNQKRFKEAWKDAKQIGSNTWTNAKKVAVWKCIHEDDCDSYVFDRVIDLDKDQH